MSPSTSTQDKISNKGDTALQNDTEVLAPATNPNLNTSASTSAHPGGPDPTTTTTGLPPSFLAKHSQNAAQGGLAPASAASTAQLADLKVKLQSNLRQFQDFPQKGILFEDIMPIFASFELHSALVSALEMLVAEAFQTRKGAQSGVDCVVGLESRGFLFGPTLALRLGAAFVPVRKAGKLPGPTVSEAYEKEYGTDHFEMQADAIPKGKKVIIVDDIIATGGSAAAAGKLVRKIGGDLLGYVFLKELTFLKGRDKLDASVHTLLD